MKSRLSRAATAVGLGTSLWLTSIAAVAAPQAQSQSSGQNQTATSQKDQKATAAPQSTTAQSTTQAANKRPLSVNEDPSMIGKRNINKGLWGKIAAGTDKDIHRTGAVGGVVILISVDAAGTAAFVLRTDSDRRAVSTDRDRSP